jgi:hypothetical protein
MLEVLNVSDAQSGGPELRGVRPARIRRTTYSQEGLEAQHPLQQSRPVTDPLDESPVQLALGDGRSLGESSDVRSGRTAPPQPNGGLYDRVRLPDGRNPSKDAIFEHRGSMPQA